jgi:Arc/MetJ-type ribon-helix-helix transcriptional regulator
MLRCLAYALAKENETFIERMIKLGRFNNQSEVVREPCAGWSARRILTSIRPLCPGSN